MVVARLNSKEAAVEATWCRAVEVADNGDLHEAVYQLECARKVLLEEERTFVGRGSSRGRLVARRLLRRLDEDIERHLRHLRSNLYQALRVPIGATPKQLKKSYRELSLKFHPDKSHLSPQLFTVIKHAYEILSDEARRNTYQAITTQNVQKTPEDDDGADVDFSTLIQELRRTPLNRDRRLLLSDLTSNQLRSLLTRAGITPPSFFNHSALLAAAADTMKPRLKPSQPENVPPETDTNSSSQQPVHPATDIEETDDTLTSNKKSSVGDSSFVHNLRQQMNENSQTASRIVLPSSRERLDVQAEVEFWTKAAESRTPSIDLLEKNTLASSPQPLAAGGWFWG